MTQIIKCILSPKIKMKSYNDCYHLDVTVILAILWATLAVRSAGCMHVEWMIG